MTVNNYYSLIILVNIILRTTATGQYFKALQVTQCFQLLFFTVAYDLNIHLHTMVMTLTHYSFDSP